eukprot:05370.XXX_230905_229539_1 [CDS] Oithona nana genome sequencing.
MAHANSLQHRGGLDFFALARGGERSYSTSFLVNLDPDLLSLCASAESSTYQLCLQALSGHTQRIFKMIKGKSKREINQFCFGSTYVQLNPNYRKFDRMDPMTWKKEGISSHWTGVRGFRKKCCKVCCVDLTCNGCGVCRGCTNSPVRGNYDGLVVLAAITRETLPNYANAGLAHTLPASRRKPQEGFQDHEHFVLAMEAALSATFMYAADPDLQLKCVPTNRAAVSLGESVDDGRSKQKKFVAYAIYVAYRLDPPQVFNHQAKISRQISVSAAVPAGGNSGSSNMFLPGAAAAGGGEPAEVTVHELQQQRGGIGISIDDLPEEEIERRSGSSSSSGLLKRAGGTGAYDIEDIDDFEFGEEEDEKLLEDLEDKQLRQRITALENENSNVKEQVWKLEHGRNWMENRLTAMEADLQSLKEEKEKSS